MKNYYEILEVNKKASNEVIENTYKVLLKKYKNENADAVTINNLNEAYKVLTDSFLRSQYDLELEKEKEEELKVRKPQKVKKEKVKIKEEKPIRIGTFRSLAELTKDVFKNMPDREQLKELKNIDMKALALTILILIILGVILWFIPFTNGWVRELTVDNPLISWMFKK